MSLKIDNNESIIAYHALDGAVVFPYKVDARMAVATHPLEWSFEPWSQSDAKRGRDHIIARHERETEAAEAAARAKHSGAPKPLNLPEEVELTDEDRAELEEYDRAVEAAKERLSAHREKKAAEKAEAEQIAADEAILKSPPPSIIGKRPFGRPGEPTPAEIESMRKRDEKKAADDKVRAEKAEADRIAAAEANGAKLTT